MSGASGPADGGGDARPPAFVNAKAGTAKDAVAALKGAGLEPQALPPGEIADRVRRERDRGTRRIVVAGGDGTIATAASELAGHPTELAVLPGGTLNHFAKDNGIPTDLAEAAQLATTGAARPVDVARVNGHLFLNTSSVGAYVTFVHDREALEKRVGYRLATVGAAIRTMWHVHPFSVSLDVDGEERRYRTPMIFVGVGERELQIPVLGGRVEGGRAGLQLFVVTGRSRTTLLRYAGSALFRGKRAASRTPLLDSFLVERCRIEMRRRRGNVATDGEVQPMDAPLAYEIQRGALQVVAPAPKTAGPAPDGR